MITPSRTTSLLAVTVVAAAAGAGFIASRHHAVAAGASAITVGRGTVGRTIPAGFAGLSMEFRGLASYAGSDPKAPNPVFEQLLRNLAPGQTPVLRVGGDGTDWTWYPVRGMARPGGVKYDLTKSYMQVARAVAQAVNARLIMGVNLEANSTRLAAAEAKAEVDGIGRRWIQGLEIGNEPELYGSFSWYKAPNGQHILGRPRSYNFDGFLGDYSRMAHAIPNVPLAGPSSGSPSYIAQLSRFLHTEPRVKVATLHRYPLKHCTKSSNVTMSQLLSSGASNGLASSVAPDVSTAHSRHIPLRIDELNAISCGGVRGVSDTFGSALWALDALFAMARTGVDGVNFHTVPRTINELISAEQTGGHWQSVVHPQYYGMMMFAQAAPGGAKLLRIGGHRAAGVSVWATAAPDKHVRVVLINKNLGRSQIIRMKIPGTTGDATVERLEAPSAYAKSGVTLGGQTFGSKTSTGKLAGTSSTSTIAAAGGRYVVTLPAASAAMLTLSEG